MRALSAILALLLFFFCTTNAIFFSNAQLIPMQKITIKNATARLSVANDGSPGIFYWKDSLYKGEKDSNNVLLMMEGGWFCYDAVSCAVRFKGDKSLMSSTVWKQTKHSTGYNSADCLKNPFCKFRQVYVPYISSDGWVGNMSETDEIKWQFRGKNILRSVFEDLFQGFSDDGGQTVYKITPGATLLLVGESAGAIGALWRANEMGDLVKSLCPSCDYAVLPDSGVFIGDIVDNTESIKPCTHDPMRCPYKNEIMIGYKAWGVTVDPACAEMMKILKKPLYQCLYGSYAASVIKYRFFLASYLFDAAEIFADTGLKNLLNVTDLEFLTRLTFLRRTIFDKYPSFAPSCFGHVLGTSAITAGDVSYGDALSLWFFDGVNASYKDKCMLPECRKGCNKK